MKLKTLVGYAGLHILNLLPDNGSVINLGQQSLRGFFSRLYLERCGSNVNVHKSTSFSHSCCLGNNSGIGRGALMYGPVYIGNDVMMGTDCLIYTQNHEFNDRNVPMRLQGPQKCKPVYIDDNVWIGGRVTILPGVHIGSGAVIGAGSVVTRNVPENMIVAGNPAVIIRERGL